MWSKFTARANDIDEVFDTSRVDTSEFTRDGYQFKVAWIDDEWWDADKHLLTAPIAEMVFEPVVGGGIIDRGTDGSELRWATVRAWEPPRRVVFSWDVAVQWQLETDPAKASEVEVTFTPVDAGHTRVVRCHRHLDRHGEGWQGMRDAVGSGWSLAGYAAVAGRP